MKVTSTRWVAAFWTMQRRYDRRLVVHIDRIGDSMRSDPGQVAPVVACGSSWQGPSAGSATFPPRRQGSSDAAASWRKIERRCDARLVSLVGPGGVGKTRLAVRMTTDLRRGFAGGAWWVEFAEIREAALVTNAVVAALDLRDLVLGDRKAGAPRRSAEHRRRARSGHRRQSALRPARHHAARRRAKRPHARPSETRGHGEAHQPPAVARWRAAHRAGARQRRRSGLHARAVHRPGPNSSAHRSTPGAAARAGAS